MKKQEFICPKCGSNNWKVPLYARMNSIETRECGDCGYTGTFLVNKKGKLSKQDKEVLKDLKEDKRINQ